MYVFALIDDTSETSKNIFFVEVHFEISEFESGWSYKKDMWHPIISIIISENCFVWIACCLLVCVFVCVCVMFEFMNSVCSQTCKRSFVVTLYISKWSETKPWHWMIDWDTTKDFFCCLNFLNYAGNRFFCLFLINRTWLKRETTSTQVILNNESNLINDIHKLVEKFYIP